eukprot:scaffold2391_cov124-Isochrysis_galbana.AAC.3
MAERILRVLPHALQAQGRVGPRQRSESALRDIEPAERARARRSHSSVDGTILTWHTLPPGFVAWTVRGGKWIGGIGARRADFTWRMCERWDEGSTCVKTHEQLVSNLWGDPDFLTA